ncbi:MAG TPA: hypothetical protein VEP90_13650 [Methylomirabilota bacterium]|nr:hypothetical protein [Methylomirabilota bacterium]
MDPITIGIEAVGLGLSLWGSSQQSGIAKQQAEVSRDIATQEQGINAQRQQQMQLEARRSQLQNFRNAQRLRAQSTNAAVNQGAQFGSGLQGGLAGITDKETENAVGINQGMAISQNIFGLNNKISSDKAQLASLGGDAATAAGYTSLGGSLIKAGPTLGGFGKDVSAGFGQAMSLFSPGSLSGGLV